MSTKYREHYTTHLTAWNVLQYRYLYPLSKFNTSAPAFPACFRGHLDTVVTAPRTRVAQLGAVEQCVTGHEQLALAQYGT